jgi:hypothetical protein
MTHLNHTEVRTIFLGNTLAQLQFGWMRLCLRVLLSIPVGIAKGVFAFSDAIAESTRMAYVDPFSSNREERK